MNKETEGRSLVDVFAQQMRDTDNDMPVAFIAVLHELDQRQRLLEKDLNENTRLFDVTAKTLGKFSDQQDKLPGRVLGASQSALNNTLKQIRQESHDGAASGVRPVIKAIETLEQASEDYDDRKHWLTRLMFFGLPIAFCAAVLIGILFGNFAIRTLPADWQWTCRVVGAQHWKADNGKLYCITRKD